MSPTNKKKAWAYVFCFLIAIIVGGACAGVVAMLGAPALGIAGAGATGFTVVMGFGCKLIGPFDFTDGGTPPTVNQQGASVT